MHPSFAAILTLVLLWVVFIIIFVGLGCVVTKWPSALKWTRGLVDSMLTGIVLGSALCIFVAIGIPVADHFTVTLPERKAQKAYTADSLAQLQEHINDNR